MKITDRIPKTPREQEIFYQQSNEKLKDTDLTLSDLDIHIADLADDTDSDSTTAQHVTNAQVKVYGDHGRIVNGNPHGTDHSMLESIEGTGTRHITANENAEITAIDGLATGIVTKTADATYSGRTITGTSGEITVTNGNGVSGNPTISLPAVITTPLKFGTASNNSEVEADGTLVFNGDATVWEDLNFDPDSSGGPAVTLPDYVTINNVVHREFTSLNNQLCGGNEEVPHSHKLGTTIYPHCHIFLKAAESSGTTGVTFTFYWELRQDGSTTSGSVTLSATSAQLAANGHKITIRDTTGFTGPTELGSNLAMKIARTAGDAGDVIVTTYGVHYQVDMVGSRTVSTK